VYKITKTRLSGSDKFNYYAKIADDYVRTFACYHRYIVKDYNLFFYLLLMSDVDDHKKFKRMFVKLRENYFRKTGHIVWGQIETNEYGENYHAHLVIVPDPGNQLIEPQKKNPLILQLRDEWQKVGGTKIQFTYPDSDTEGNGPLGQMFYLCKAKKNGKYVKTKFGGQTNFVHCNLGKRKPWANYTLPSEERNRRKIVSLVDGFFKMHRADPNKSQQARMPRFPSVHTELLN